MLLFYFFLLIVGLIVGSFISMLTYRLPRGIALRGRSKCVSCGKQIKWFHNIPVLAYVFLKGRCGMCSKRISLRYPGIELVTASSFVLTGYLWLYSSSSLLDLIKGSVPTFSSLPFLLLLVTCYLGLAIADLEFQILPDEISLALGILIFSALFLFPSPLLFLHILWGLIAFLLFLAIYFITRGRGMGFGDVKLSFVFGSFFGYPNILVWLFLSFTSGAIVGILLLFFKRAKLKQEIAFGPYLIFSSFVTLFFGDDILKWYLGLLQ